MPSTDVYSALKRLFHGYLFTFHAFSKGVFMESYKIQEYRSHITLLVLVQ